MEDVFRSFCTFGSGLHEDVALMDGAKFGKFCRDTKILDKKLTSTDADIIFAQVKGNAGRKISFSQFMEVIQLMAEKKHRGEKNPELVLQAKILDTSGPSVASATRPIKSDAVERMTDTSQYTGMHKERFDDYGKGKGLSGRDAPSKGKGTLPGLVGNQSGYVDGYKNEGTYKSSPKQKRDSSLVANVTDRLTDTTKYTGAHKHRFDATGHGLGMAGRDLPAKGAGMSPGCIGTQAGYVHGYRNEGTYGRK